MEIVLSQLVVFFMIVWLLIIATTVIKAEQKDKLKKAKWFILPIVIIIFSMLFMPVKLTQHNMSVHEENRFNNVPTKVVIEIKSFDESQKTQFNKLKEESKNAE